MPRNVPLFHSASLLQEGHYDAESAYEALMGRKPPVHPEGSRAYSQFDWTPQRKRTLGDAATLAGDTD